MTSTLKHQRPRPKKQEWAVKLKLTGAAAKLLANILETGQVPQTALMHTIKKSLAGALERRQRDLFDRKAKARAHQLVSRAIYRGEIVPGTECEDCGKESSRLIGHHEDYSKPLWLHWLCNRCHAKRHPR